MSLFHESSAAILINLKQSPPASLLISGTDGLGLLDAATMITNNHPIIISPDPSSKSRAIKAETIRELYTQTRSKLTDKLFIIIDESDRMTHSAQTAFLKLLEEPAANVHFILLSYYHDRLLPTIRSRTQHHHLQPVTLRQSEQFLTQIGITDATKRQQLLYIAEGLPDKLRRLASDDDYFQKSVKYMQDAKVLLQAPVYERLLLVSRYKDRVEALELVMAAITITRRSLKHQPSGILVKQLDGLLEVESDLQANHNTKLTLANFVL